MGGNAPVVDTILVSNGKFVGNILQRQNDHGLRLPAGDNQAAGDRRTVIQFYHHRTLGAVKIGTAGGQGPAVFLPLYRLEGHRVTVSTSFDREHNSGRNLRGFNDVGDFSGVARETTGKQIKGQIIFSGCCENVITHGVAAGRQVAHITDARDAVLHSAVDLVEGRIEPGKRRAVDFGILLLHCGDHSVQVNRTGGGGLHGAAQNMGVLEGCLKHGGVVPVGTLNAPSVGAPVV